MEDKQLVCIGAILMIISTILIWKASPKDTNFSLIEGKVIDSNIRNGILFVEIERTKKEKIIIYNYKGPSPKEGDIVIAKIPKKSDIIIGEEIVILNRKK